MYNYQTQTTEQFDESYEIDGVWYNVTGTGYLWWKLVSDPMRSWWDFTLTARVDRVDPPCSESMLIALTDQLEHHREWTEPH